LAKEAYWLKKPIGNQNGSSTMSSLLKTLAVTRQGGDAASELLGAYLGTNPEMALNHTIEAKQKTPTPAGAVDPFAR
jgi:hypothetical protein